MEEMSMDCQPEASVTPDLQLVTVQRVLTAEVIN